MKLPARRPAWWRIAAFATGLGCWASAAFLAFPRPAPLTVALPLPTSVHSLIVLVDRSRRNPRFHAERAQQVAVALRYFTPRTSWAFVDAMPLQRVHDADAVIFLGLDPVTPLSHEALLHLAAARKLIVSGGHLAEVRDAGIAFAHVRAGYLRPLPHAISVIYHERALPAGGFAYDDRVAADAPARVLAVYRGARSPDVPYIVEDEGAVFINGEFAFDAQTAKIFRRGATIVACSVLIEAFRAAPLPVAPVAMLRLEDVSVQTPARRLAAIVAYLTRAGVPYGIGVIPDQLIRGIRLAKLSDDVELVEVLRYAQAHGATIVLHGLHHSFNSPEDFEFWDARRNRPLRHDSRAWMRARVLEGIEAETALGLHPLMWETPHYSASALDYATLGELFSTAWERRAPVGWLPWVLQKDQFGTRLLPEDLGYVAVDRSETVAIQLERARDLLLCRGCVAAGFLHPSTVEMRAVIEYVQGLRNLGYRFADPRTLVPAAAPGTSKPSA